MKNNSILFIITIIIFLLGIGFINYYTDPYRIFHPYKKYTQLLPEDRNLIYANLKAYKHRKHKYLIIGSSDAGNIFSAFSILNIKNIQMISINKINKKQEYELLKNYLDLHPEIKHVYIVASYYSKMTEHNEKIPVFTQGKYSLNELMILLYSHETLLKSLKDIKNGVDKTKPGPFQYERFSFPNMNYIDKFSEQKFEQWEQINFEYTKKEIELLKEKGIKYTFIFPPYNGAFLGMIYKDNIYLKYIENYKRFIVNQAGIAYDFAFINKYTCVNILKEQYLFSDMYHASPIYGIKISKYFFDNENAEKNICFVLNKNNIERILKEERKFTEEYVKSHPDIFEYYQKNDESNYNKSLIMKKLPQDAIQEIEYVKKKTNQPH